MLRKLKKDKGQKDKRCEPQLGEPSRADGLKEAQALRRSVLEADPFAYQASHRRMVTVVRILVFVVVVLATSLTAALVVIKHLMPLKTTEIALLRVDPNDDRIYAIEPLSVEVDGFELMLEKMARRFVAQLLTIDGISQDVRFEEVRRYSDRAYFSSFLNANQQRIETALKDGLNRSITVESASLLDAYDGVYMYSVEFVQTDKIGSKDPEQRKLRAYLEMTTRPQEVTTAERFENPLGIRVLDLSVKERHSE